MYWDEEGVSLSDQVSVHVIWIFSGYLKMTHSLMPTLKYKRPIFESHYFMGIFFIVVTLLHFEI